MTRAIEFLRSFGAKPQAEQGVEGPFEQRLKKLETVRPVSVSRAVLFRTRPEHQEA